MVQSDTLYIHHKLQKKWWPLWHRKLVDNNTTNGLPRWHFFINEVQEKIQEKIIGKTSGKFVKASVLLISGKVEMSLKYKWSLNKLIHCKQFKGSWSKVDVTEQLNMSSKDLKYGDLYKKRLIVWKHHVYKLNTEKNIVWKFKFITLHIIQEKRLKVSNKICMLVKLFVRENYDKPWISCRILIVYGDFWVKCSWWGRETFLTFPSMDYRVKTNVLLSRVEFVRVFPFPLFFHNDHM